MESDSTQLIEAAVIGSNGFIGSNVFSLLSESQCAVTPITREVQLSELRGRKFDWVIFCAGNSAAFRSVKEPLACLQQNVFDLYAYLESLEYDKFIYMSSASVYPDFLQDKREDSSIDIADLSLYGAHKYLSEQYVKRYTKGSWIILRPGYLFGHGLWKNIFFDLRAGGKDIYLKPDSYIAALDVQKLAEAVYCLANDCEDEIFNIASSHGVCVQDLLDIKGGEFVLHSERYINESGLSLEKISKYWKEAMSREAYLSSIARYLKSTGHES